MPAGIGLKAAAAAERYSNNNEPGSYGDDVIVPVHGVDGGRDRKARFRNEGHF